MTNTLIGLLGLGLLGWMVHFAYRRSSFGVGLALAALFVHHSFGMVRILQVGSVSISTTDVATAALAIAGSLRLFMLKAERPKPGLPLAALIVYVLAESAVVLASVVQYGEASFQVSRLALGHIACMVYLVSFPVSAASMRKVFRVAMVYAGAIVAIFVLRAAHVLPLAPAVASTLSPGSYTALRYIVNYQSLAIGWLALSLLLLHYDGRGSRGVASLLVVLGLTVIVVIVPQRMVWLLFLLGLVYLVGIRTRKSIAYAAVFAGVAAVVAPIILLAVDLGPLGSVLSAVLDAATDPLRDFAGSTGGGRLLDWQVLASSTFESGKALFGQGYIPQITRYLGRWDVVSYGIHNLLVGKFVYGGIFLLSATLFLWVSVLGAYVRSTIAEIPRTFKQVAGLAMAAVMLFSFSSGPGLELGLTVGICLRFALDGLISSHADTHNVAIVGMTFSGRPDQ